MKVYLLLAAAAFLTSGCIPKYVDQNPADSQVSKEKAVSTKIKTEEKKEQSKSYKVTMKTKKFAFSDTGFLVQNKKMLRLNVLAAGKPVLDLKIKKSDDICVGSLCNTKEGFNQSFLSGDYPDDLIENVLLGKPIFEGQNLTKTAAGFVQNLEHKKYKIRYQTAKGSIYFKDSQNKIIMKLKEL